MFGRPPTRRWRARLVALVLALAAALGAGPAGAPLTAREHHAYHQYRLLAPNRAFAVAANGDGYFWSGTSGHDPGRAVERALTWCQEESDGPCRLQAVNNVVLAGADWKALAPPALARIGRLSAAPFWQNAGPQGAAGLVVWSHGYTPGRDFSASAAQSIVVYFTGRGYDYYRFDRERGDNWAADATDVAEAVRQAKSMGYRRVILIGQANGAWVSLAAAGRGAPVDGVIAVSPAAHGKVADMRDVAVARDAWRELVAAIKPGPRIALVMYDKDEFDVGGRGDDATAAFAASGVDAVLINRPPGFSGHYAGSNRFFWPLYGPCIRGFVATGERMSPCGQ